MRGSGNIAAGRGARAGLLGGSCWVALGTLLLACSSSTSSAGGGGLGSKDGGGKGVPSADATSADANDPSVAHLSDVGKGWQVGVAVADVSPTPEELAPGQLYMGAYGIGEQRGPATGVHDKVYARAMVLRTGTNAIVFTIMDMPGASNRILHAISDAVNAEIHIPKQNIYVGSTHSHSAPDLQGLWGGVPAEYKTRLIGLASQAIIQAFKDAAPADLMVSKGTGPNRNRRSWPITDKELTVLDAKGKDGTHIGTLINFAAHPVKLGAGNKLISRDFCGYTVDYAEQKLGTKVLFFNGVVGDASPDGGVGNEFDAAKSFGEMVADAALGTMTAQTKVSPGIFRDYEQWRQPVTNGGFKVLSQFKSTLGRDYLDYDSVIDGDNMGIDTQAAYVRLGTELQTIIFPGEALTRTGLQVKESLKSPFRLWLGLTTDSLGYFLKSDEFGPDGVNSNGPDGKPRNNGYEETVSCDQGAGDNAIKILTAAIGKDPSAP